MKDKQFWITACLANLCIVALLGLGLRSKILFTIPFIDYRSLLSAHSHFAFAGWAGLALMSLMIHLLLPNDLAKKKAYAFILIGIQVSSIGMAIAFPFFGYNSISIFFSTLYIAVTVVFAIVYTRDIIKVALPKNIKLLSIGAVACLIFSYLGTLGIIYILSSQSGNSTLYRDSIYTFLHFQYNGFFTLGLFALYYHHRFKKGIVSGLDDRRFIFFLCASIVPSLFLALLWHNNTAFYALAAIGCICMLAALLFFLRSVFSVPLAKLYMPRLANNLALFAAICFVLKILLNAGTIIPALGDAIYGDRPIIIGFLHLVFLGLLSFYLLATFTDQGTFTLRERLMKWPLIIFSTGIFLNEILLFLQGLIILLNYNSSIFKWLLWGAAIILFLGSIMLLAARLRVSTQKKDTI